MSHLLCPISRQPVQFCESAACFGFFSGFFCLFVLFLVGGVCLFSEKICMGVGTVCMCMNALENNLFKKGVF